MIWLHWSKPFLLQNPGKKCHNRITQEQNSWYAEQIDTRKEGLVLQEKQNKKTQTKKPTQIESQKKQAIYFWVTTGTRRPRPLNQDFQQTLRQSKFLSLCHATGD